MKRYLFLIFGLVSLMGIGFWACSKAPQEKTKESEVRVGPVKLNTHPTNLEGKIVVLRWNGKFNGDNFLNRVGELLTQQVKSVKIIKMWEVDSSTASIPKTLEESEKIALKIADQKPDLVIASQAD